MESGLEGQMSTHRHEEDESLMEMGSGRFGYFFSLVYFFSGVRITEGDARSELLVAMRYSIAGIAITKQRSCLCLIGL